MADRKQTTEKRQRYAANYSEYACYNYSKGIADLCKRKYMLAYRLPQLNVHQQGKVYRESLVHKHM